MGITGQNMPQISNSLLSPTKSMVAMGNQWNQGQTVMHLQCSETITTYNGYKTSKYASNFKFPIITH